MSIITWFEFGKKFFGLFDAQHFVANNSNFPIFESHRKNYEEIMAFSEGEILLVSNDRKKYRLVQPIAGSDEAAAPVKESRSKKISRQNITRKKKAS